LQIFTQTHRLIRSTNCFAACRLTAARYPVLSVSTNSSPHNRTYNLCTSIRWRNCISHSDIKILTIIIIHTITRHIRHWALRMTAITRHEQLQWRRQWLLVRSRWQSRIWSPRPERHRLRRSIFSSMASDYHKIPSHLINRPYIPSFSLSDQICASSKFASSPWSCSFLCCFSPFINSMRTMESQMIT